MAGKRRRFTPEFKARVALEALREHDSVQGDREAARASSEPGEHMEAAVARGAAGGVRRGRGPEAREGARGEGSGTCMQRSGASRSSGIFFGAGSSAEPGGAGADDRAGRTAESFKAVRAGGGEPVSLYYRPGGESARTLALMRRMDELHMAYPFLREQADDAASAPRGALPRAGTGSGGSCA